MPRYFITLAYNGLDFHGWQSQENSITIQSKLQEAIGILIKEDVQVTGAGRTDAGVHASFYVAHFDSTINIVDIPIFIKSLNGILKSSIVIFDVFEVDSQFHARYSAWRRTYKYFITQTKNVFLKDFTYYYPYELDIDLMNAAANFLMGQKDFKSFQKSKSGVENSVCTVYDAKWHRVGNLLIFQISANRFLRNMVRSIVGTLIDIGRKKITYENFCDIVNKKNRKFAGVSVPANGLFLTNINYPQPIDDILEKSRKLAIFNFHLN